MIIASLIDFLFCAEYTLCIHIYLYLFTLTKPLQDIIIPML